jgi:hypothetical protein
MFYVEKKEMGKRANFPIPRRKTTSRSFSNNIHLRRSTPKVVGLIGCGHWLGLT